jgi:hypothetical protein
MSPSERSAPRCPCATTGCWGRRWRVRRRPLSGATPTRALRRRSAHYCIRWPATMPWSTATKRLALAATSPRRDSTAIGSPSPTTRHTRSSWTSLQGGVMHCATDVCSCGVEGRHLDVEIIIQAQGPAVLQLVVERAECLSVVQVVGSVEVEPSDVRCVQTHGSISELTIEAAEGALTIPRDENPPWPGSTASSAGQGPCRVCVDSVGIEPTAARTSVARLGGNSASTSARTVRSKDPRSARSSDSTVDVNRPTICCVEWSDSVHRDVTVEFPNLVGAQTCERICRALAST